jgi:hypothetical protein
MNRFWLRETGLRAGLAPPAVTDFSATPGKDVHPGPARQMAKTARHIGIAGFVIDTPSSRGARSTADDQSQARHTATTAVPAFLKRMLQP